MIAPGPIHGHGFQVSFIAAFKNIQNQGASDLYDRPTKNAYIFRSINKMDAWNTKKNMGT